MSKIKELYEKYKEIILYLIFGGLTTLVSFVSFWLFNLVLGIEEQVITQEELSVIEMIKEICFTSVSEILSWVLAVAFAYVVNKLFVFESKSWAWSVLKKELPPFVIARVFSLAVELGGILLLVYPLNFRRIGFAIFGFDISGLVIAKLILSVVVVILNYFFSKFIIFKKKEEPTEEPTATVEAQEEK